jgi:hypothetical protein
MSNRLNQDREAKLQPLRMQTAIKKINDLGFYIVDTNETTLKFYFKDEIITYHVYSGWASGKSIKDGRGLERLLKQLK